MGVKERRERQKENLRQHILDVARELFVTEGYENVSMRRIAERIEYSPTTIYLYFKDKRELFDTLCHEAFSKLVERLGTLAQNKDDGAPLSCLRNGMRAYVDFGLEHPNHYTIAFIIHPAYPGDEEHKKFEDSAGFQAFNYLPRLVSACIELKLFRPVDVEMTSQAIWAALHGIVSLFIAHKQFPWTDQNQLIDHLIDIVIQGLKA